MKKKSKPGNSKVSINITTEGTLNIQSFYEAYVRLGFNKKNKGDR